MIIVFTPFCLVLCRSGVIPKNVIIKINLNTIIFIAVSSFANLTLMEATNLNDLKNTKAKNNFSYKKILECNTKNELKCIQVYSSLKIRKIS